MRKLLIFFAVLISACNNNKNNIHELFSNNKITTDTNAISYKKYRLNKSQTIFYIKDPTKYSIEFLKEFKKSHGIYKSVSLIEDRIIINNNRDDSIIIPTDLPLDTRITYKKCEKDIEYFLTVKRINYSSLEYFYREAYKGKIAKQHMGVADIKPTFYFGVEGTFDDKEGKSYGMNEYVDKSDKNCWISVYIGIGNISKCFVIHNCETNKEKTTTHELNRVK